MHIFFQSSKKKKKEEAVLDIMFNRKRAFSCGWRSLSRYVTPHVVSVHNEYETIWTVCVEVCKRGSAKNKEEVRKVLCKRFRNAQRNAWSKDALKNNEIKRFYI